MIQRIDQAMDAVGVAGPRQGGIVQIYFVGQLAYLLFGHQVCHHHSQLGQLTLPALLGHLCQIQLTDIVTFDGDFDGLTSGL